MTSIRELVQRWLKNNVEIDSLDVPSLQNGSVNSIERLREQKDPNDGTPSYDFEAELQNGFEYKHDTKFATTGYDAFGNFLSWMNRQRDKRYVARNYFASAMKEGGFEQESGDDGWFYRGIRLKEKE